MTIDALPNPPARTDDPSTFVSKADAFIAALVNFVTQANSTAAAVNADKVQTSSDRVQTGLDRAQTGADVLTTAAAVSACSATANVTKWVSGTTYTQGQNTWSPINYQTYRRKTSGAGETDPSLDAANWALIGASTQWAIKTASYTALAGDSIQANTTSAAFTITLPATPSANDLVRIADYGGTFAINNLTVGRNGSNIMGLAEDMVISTNNASLALTYIDATQGWRII